MAELLERSRRVPLSLSIEASGKDAGGNIFDESTRTVNISGGGVCFESNRHLSIGATLTLTIQLPEALRKRFGDRSVYRARAIVCRVERFEGQHFSRVGARFIGEADT
jgi:PilZ domain